MNDGGRQLLKIGEWRVDSALDEIARDGTTVKLEPRAMQLLIRLAESAGDVVSVDDLLTSVWKDVVVTQDSVYQAVAALRRALGDDPKDPRYIANVVRRGYRLIAPVELGGDLSEATVRDAPAAQTPTAGTPVVSKLGSLRLGLIAAGLVIAIILGVLVALGIFATKPAVTAARPLVTSPSIATDLSVAVLPFDDLSEGKDQGYLADGLTEELINRLSTIAGLNVAARTSSFYFKSKQPTLADVGHVLGVAHVLEGSIRKNGDTLRVTTQLVRVASGYQEWSQTFDRPLRDVFKVEDDITGAVLQALKLSIIYHFRPRAAPTENIEAYTLYLRALSDEASNGGQDYDAAIQRLHSSLILDPKFSDAWALLALVNVWDYFYAVNPRAESCRDARIAADQALKLNPQLEEAHRALGLISEYCDHDTPAAEAEFVRALQLQPGDEDALRSYSWLITFAGRQQEGLELAKRAIAREPLNPWNYVAAGDASWRLDHTADAEADYRRAVDLSPTTATLHALFANVLLSANKPVEAVSEAEKEPDSVTRALALPISLDAAGRKTDAEREIAVYISQHPEDPGEIAVFYACRHDADATVVWLAKYAARHEGEFMTLPNRMACFRNVESDPRYQELIRKIRADKPPRSSPN